MQSLYLGHDQAVFHHVHLSYTRADYERVQPVKRRDHREVAQVRVVLEVGCKSVPGRIGILVALGEVLVDVVPYRVVVPTVPERAAVNQVAQVVGVLHQFQVAAPREGEDVLQRAPLEKLRPS